MSALPPKHPSEMSEPQPGPSSGRRRLKKRVLHPSTKRSSEIPKGGPEEEDLRTVKRSKICSPPSPGFVKASVIRKEERDGRIPSNSKQNIFKNPESSVPAPSSLSSTEDEDVQKRSGSKTLAPKEGLSNANVLSKKWRTARNKRRKTNVPCSSAKITKYFQTDSARIEPKKKKSSPKKHPGWDKKNEDLLETITDNEKFFRHYQDRYGLVENSVEEPGEDYFSNLPTHIIELILCTVPIVDFMNCRLVCRRWMEVIDNPRFMHWKKMYYKYKKDGQQDYRAMMKAATTHLNHQRVDGCVETLVNFMGKEFNRLPSSDMHHLLLRNAHGELADQVLKERFPQWNGKECRVWCMLCVSVLLCETVWDVLQVYLSLVPCGLRTDLHDALFCLATFLFHFRRTENINSGLHYRVYYALYVIENNIPICQRGRVRRIKNIPGQQNIQNYGESEGGTLTYEQIRILNHRFDLNQKIKIVALAGSGKTTTLVHLAKLYPQIRFLNIVFNKSVNREAKRKFPPNVICKTAHSIAYDAVGRDLRHKLCSVVRAHDLISHLAHHEDCMHAYLYARLVLGTLCNFMYSGDLSLAETHVPTGETEPLSHDKNERILMDARKIWQKMEDSLSDIRITHDVYLKLYQLSRPKLDQFQCIMVDEAQDCNPAILDIVMSQTVPVILVGDPHQQIYAFRGVQNALQRTTATHTYSLTKSFRFGPQISYVASVVLEVSLNVTERVLVGNDSDSNLRGETSGQFAVIARSNIVLFNEAVRIVVLKRLKSHEPQNIRPFFAGGLASYGFDQMLDIYMLKFPSIGDKLKDRFIGRFSSFMDLCRYAKLSNDRDLKSKIELVNQHGHDVPKFLAVLKQSCTSDMQSATVIFTTAHKSKGLEFDTVSLTEDYVISPTTLVGEQQHNIEEESNILYVAITRAKRCLLLPEKVTKLLYAVHEKFEYPVSSAALLEDSGAAGKLMCVQCENSFAPHTVLAVVRRKTLMASGREVHEGALCMKCRSDPTVRPDVHLNGLIMYLDPVPDNAHRLMNALAGPLPSDPPLLHDDRFNEFADAERVFVINLNIH